MFRLATVSFVLILSLWMGVAPAQQPDCDPPVIHCPPLPIEVTMCGAGQVCIEIPMEKALQVQADLATVKSNQICFYVDTTGTYVITIIASNECGADTCVITALVTINTKPTITCPESLLDTLMCAPGQVCTALPIENADAVEVEGADWAEGQLCFQADTTGTYQFTVSAKNGCGTVTCDITYSVVISTPPVIDCPSGTVELQLCPGDIGTIPLPIENTYSVTVSNGGSWTEGNLYFLVQDSGLYTFRVVAVNECGADTCDLSVNVSVGTVPEIICPAEEIDTIIGAPQQICIPLPILNPGTVTVEGGTWANDQLCIDVQVAGTRTIKVIASDYCGADTCHIIVTVNWRCYPDLPAPMISVDQCGTVIQTEDGLYTQFHMEVLNWQEFPDSLFAISPDLPPCGLNPDASRSWVFIYGQYDQYVNLLGVYCGIGHASELQDALYFAPPFGPNDPMLPTGIFIRILDRRCNLIYESSLFSLANEQVNPYIGCPETLISRTACAGDYVYVDLPIFFADQVTVTGAERVGDQIRFLADSTGAKSAFVEASNDCGRATCVVNLNLTVIQHPQVCFTLDSATHGQSPVIVYFGNCTPVSGNMTYLWDFGDGSSSTDFAPAHAYDSNGCYDVSLTVTNECGSSTGLSEHFVCITDAQVVIPTNEWINIYCTAPTLDGEPLSEGDIISAYDPQGVLCGMGLVQDDGSYGFIPIYRDDPFTGFDEGAEPGDVISLRINFENVFVQPPLVWTEYGDSFEVCEFTTQNCRTVHLDEGWNLISWNIAYEGDVADLVANFADCVDVVLGFDQGGLSYNPDLPDYSTLSHVDYYHGYWFKMNCPVDFEICAPPIPQAGGIQLFAGWNLIGYWPGQILPVDAALALILNDLQVLLGFDHGGLTWMPGTPQYNTLTEMKPGLGYWARMALDRLLIYPGFTAPTTTAKVVPRAPVDGVAPSQTWISLYGAHITVDGSELSDGSKIEAFTTAGVRCGTGIYANGRLKFTPVYGYDISSAATSAYPQVGETVNLYVNGIPVSPSLIWEGNGASANISGMHTKPDGNSTALPERYALAQNHPNPFNPATEISFSLPEPGQVRLEVFNLLGQRVTTLVDGYQSAGEYTVTWNGRDDSGRRASSGIYLYRLTAGSYTETRKMVLAK